MEGRLPAMLRLETLVVVEDPSGPADVSDALLREFVFERKSFGTGPTSSTFVTSPRRHSRT